MLDVRYIKLHFALKILEDTILPIDKTSAFRGGIGEMLLRANCIRDRYCEKCEFENECLVRRIMYSKYEIRPSFMTAGESIGYVFECEDQEEEFYEGELLEVSLILFGKNIVYFNQYLQALYALGMQGIGKHKSRFEICLVQNTRRQTILQGDYVFMENFKVEKLSDYVSYRLKDFTEKETEKQIVFFTPVSIKYEGKLLQKFNLDALYTSLSRRIYLLNCFEGIESNLYEGNRVAPCKIASQVVYPVSMQRYSSHQNKKMHLQGIKGSIVFQDNWNDEIFLSMLIAGEITHVGKNTSFGFGRYMVFTNHKTEGEK